MGMLLLVFLFPNIFVPSTMLPLANFGLWQPLGHPSISRWSWWSMESMRKKRGRREPSGYVKIAIIVDLPIYPWFTQLENGGDFP